MTMTEQVKPHLKDFIVYIIILFGVIIGTVLLFSQKTQDNLVKDTMKRDVTDSSNIPTGSYTSPPKMEIDINRKYTADIITSLGEIQIELFSKETPVTVNNFIFLSKQGFYDNTIFHRIIKDFMIQGGDPKGDGTGGPGYRFADEKITRDYKRGIIAMANSGPNTNGSQFFIMHKDTDLPKNYVIFGQVVKGIEVIDKIAETQTVDNGLGEQSKPTKEIKIEKITIKET